MHPSFSLIGCPSGKSIQAMLPRIPALLLPLTELQTQFLRVHAPQGFRVAIQQAVELKVTVRVSFLTAISDGLTVRTTFSILTRSKHFNGQMLLRNSQDSRLFHLMIIETTLSHPSLSWHLLDTLNELSQRVEHHRNSSTFHVLTSHKTMHAEGLVLPVLS